LIAFSLEKIMLFTNDLFDGRNRQSFSIRIMRILLFWGLSQSYSMTAWTPSPLPRSSFFLYQERRQASTTLFFHPENNQLDHVALNDLHTKLRDATAAQDFSLAGQISDELIRRLYGVDAMLQNSDQKKSLRKSLSWTGLGSAPWLMDRLNTFNYTFPTTIQINAFRAVNAILNATTANFPVSESATTLEERIKQRSQDLGIVVSGTTGSGKTLSYMVPMLSILSESLFLRQRLRINDEEAIGDTAGDLADRIQVVTSPRVVSSTSRPQKSSTTIATGAAVATLGRSGTDVRSPLALIVVPTRELGSQTAILLYQLVGGASQTIQQARQYKGPKGVRIGCVLDDEDASFGLKLQTDVAITTPQYLGKLLSDGDLDPAKLRVIVYDEADLALEQTSARDLDLLFNDDSTEREFTRLTLLVGASVTEALGNLAVSSRILPDGQSYIVTATNFVPLTTTSGSAGGSASANDTSRNSLETTQIVGAPPKEASLQDLNVCLYPGLTHERVIVENGDSSLLILTRLIRKELQNYERTVSLEETDGDDIVQRPRVVVFFPDEEQARAAISPLRDALWGDHKLCVLLPKTGVNPMTMMDQFKRNETSVMLATPNSVRGLDFPALTHCYTMYLPADDPREYLHLAGRVGRVGHRTRGRVISVLKSENAQQMDDLARCLNFTFTDVPAPTAESLLARTEDGSIDEAAIDFEKLRRSLEDTMSLVELVEDPEVDEASIEGRLAEVSAIDDDADEDDDDEESEFQ
jgi:superfamily II DNA/RNA helicase